MACGWNISLHISPNFVFSNKIIRIFSSQILCDSGHLTCLVSRVRMVDG